MNLHMALYVGLALSILLVAYLLEDFETQKQRDRKIMARWKRN